MAQLVNSINESVDALEGLFSELLDITRIDSGGVEVQSASTSSVGDMFRKLRLHFEPAAFEKGLALRLRGGKHVALADPLLVERIVRNLVSNAIRYTDDGSVLVSCRRARRAGCCCRSGTPASASAPTSRRASSRSSTRCRTRRRSRRDQRKGLGLGLAIVKRLAALMAGAARRCARRPAAARSSRSSCRSARRRAPARASSCRARGRSGITLDGRLIVVVEDEPAVREGLEVLLRGWGATSSRSTASARRAPGPQGGDPPAVPARAADRRLPARERRDRHRRDRPRCASASAARVPAIVVTGSSMTGHDKEALEHDFHLLIKPVLPNKLRAMIAFKLGRR